VVSQAGENLDLAGARPLFTLRGEGGEKLKGEKGLRKKRHICVILNLKKEPATSKNNWKSAYRGSCFAFLESLGGRMRGRGP